MKTKQEIIDLRKRMHQLVAGLAITSADNKDAMYFHVFEAMEIMEKIEELGDLKEWFGEKD